MDGQGNGNYKTIAIEICVNPDSNLKKACDNAVALTVDILKRHKLSADKVYRHYDWSGKICPSMMMKNNEPYSWSSFKAKVKEAYDKKTEEANAAAKIVTKKEDLKVGVKVKFNGNSYCYASSDGTAGKGSKPKAGNYTVTHYAKGAKYPIHIGSYGWVSLSSCGITSNTPKTPAVGKTVYFDGKAYCYASSTGTGKGSKPKAGNYKITHYAKGAKYPIHIGSYGWVSAANCTVQ